MKNTCIATGLNIQNNLFPIAEIYNNKNPVLVSIICSAYNHEKSIAKCLDSFLMQKVYFNVEVLVHEDASTDKTASILKDYEKRFPNIIKVVYESENQYKKHDGTIRKIQQSRALGKFVAFCEGDDYWTDEYKLYKQVTFLENNSEYSCCTHNSHLILNGSKKLYCNIEYECDINLKDVIEWNLGKIPHYNSIVCKREVFIENAKISRGFAKLTGDRARLLDSLMNGKVHYFPEVMSVYVMNSSQDSFTRRREKDIVYQANIMRNTSEILEGAKQYFGEQYSSIFDKEIRKCNAFYHFYNGDYKIILLDHKKCDFKALNFKQKLITLFGFILPKTTYKFIKKTKENKIIYSKKNKIISLTFTFLALLFCVPISIFSSKANGVRNNSNIYSFLRSIEKNTPSNYVIKATFSDEEKFSEVMRKVKSTVMGEVDPDFLWMGNATACITIDDSEFSIESISLKNKEPITNVNIDHFSTAQTYYNTTNGEILGPKLKVKYDINKGGWLQAGYVYIPETVADLLTEKYHIDEYSLLEKELVIKGNEESYTYKIKNIYRNKIVNDPIPMFYKTYFENGIIFSDTTTELDLYRKHKPVLCFNSKADQRNFDDMIYYLKDKQASSIKIEYYDSEAGWLYSEFNDFFDSSVNEKNVFDTLALVFSILGIACFVLCSEMLFKYKAFYNRSLLAYLSLAFILLLFISTLYVFLFKYINLLNVFSVFLSAYLSLTFFYLFFRYIISKRSKKA